jgi:hypothetical protein
MITRCLLLVAGSINVVFALVQQSQYPTSPTSISPRSGASLTTARTTTASARTSNCKLILSQRLPRTCLLQESSDSTQEISAVEYYPLDSSQSQQSQSQSPHTNTNNAPLPAPFARNEQWLEDATDDYLDEQMYPPGSLAEDDLESINALMVAWARRRSTEAALTVEKLLKRVVDDMNAGNDRVHVNTRMYTHVSTIAGTIALSKVK